MHTASTGNIACGQLRTLQIGEAVTVIDAADYCLVKPYSWHLFRLPKHTYVRARSGGKEYLMHRVILGLDHGDPRVADHIDGNGLNNARSNLRICTNAENVRNRRRSSTNSGYKGVYKVPSGFVAKIGEHNRYLGFFKSKHAAALAYNKAAVERFGQFAALNDIDRGAYRAELCKGIAGAKEHLAFLEQTLSELQQW